MNTNKLNIEKILDLYPLRVSITDFCNLNCFFCSNEGMGDEQKNLNNIDIEKFKCLVDLLYESGLKSLSITGGEPSMHPEIKNILEFINSYKFKNLFFHTNGVFLNKKLIDLLSINFNKIAISVHSINFDVWRKMTNGDLEKFDKLLKNLEYLSYIRKKSYGKITIELKLVPLMGVNDSEKDIKDFLDFCDVNDFKFKILNFEPINKNHIKFSIDYDKVINLFERVGCQRAKEVTSFRGQSSYLPYKKYYYGKTYGVVIEIGCGEKKACKECYLSNEIFITPLLQIKPCHVDEKIIDLNDCIINKDVEKIKKLLIESRVFLKKSPGVGAKTWDNNL